jgi:hypothetical protein
MAVRENDLSTFTLPILSVKENTINTGKRMELVRDLQKNRVNKGCVCVCVCKRERQRQADNSDLRTWFTQLWGSTSTICRVDSRLETQGKVNITAQVYWLKSLLVQEIGLLLLSPSTDWMRPIHITQSLLI